MGVEIISTPTRFKNVSSVMFYLLEETFKTFSEKKLCWHTHAGRIKSPRNVCKVAKQVFVHCVVQYIFLLSMYVATPTG